MGEEEQEGNRSTHTSPIALAGWGRGRDGETSGMGGIGPYRYFFYRYLFFPTSSPGEGYGLVVVVPLCAAGLSLFHTHLIYCSVGVVR